MRLSPTRSHSASPVEQDVAGVGFPQGSGEAWCPAGQECHDAWTWTWAVPTLIPKPAASWGRLSFFRKYTSEASGSTREPWGPVSQLMLGQDELVEGWTMTVRPLVTALRAKFDRILPHLDERRRRLYLASEALAIGHGGIALVAAHSTAGPRRRRRPPDGSTPP